MAEKKEQKEVSLDALRAKFGRPSTKFYDTGIKQINDLWGGGLPTGKFIELHSDSGLGKTTIFLQICVYLIETHGLKIGFMDVENALDESLKQSMGISKYEGGDNPKFVHLSPYTFSEVEITMDYYIKNGFNIIIYDSLTLTVPDRRAEGSIVDVQPGLKSALQAVFLEQYKALCARAGISLLIVNQIRTKISLKANQTKEEAAGGKALQFDTDIRTHMRRVSWLQSGTGDFIETRGIELELVTIKNKLTCPFKKVRVELIFGKGIDTISTLMNTLLTRGIVKQSGAYFSTLEGKNIQGKLNMLDHIKQNVEAYLALVDDTTEFVKEEEKDAFNIE